MQPFKKNSRVTFLGDSITAGNVYTAMIVDYYVTKLPELNVKFSCAGISGGSTGSAFLYLEDDVLANKPDYVTIMLGVNDSGRWMLERPDILDRAERLEAAYVTYVTKMNELVDKLTELGIEVILCTPAPYAEFFTTAAKPLPGGHALILRYAEAVRKMARERGLGLVDFHARMSETYLDEALYNADHVHPNDLGHARMAECFLAAQGLPVREWVADEAPAGLSARVSEWREVSLRVRCIMNTEWLIVHDYSLPTEKKLELIDDYIAGEKWGEAAFFRSLAEGYRADKLLEGELRARETALMESIYG